MRIYSAVVAILTLSLTACDRHGSSAAERRYETAKKANDADELCRQARQAADAYLEASNVDKFKEWRDRSRLECAISRLRATP